MASIFVGLLLTGTIADLILSKQAKMKARKEDNRPNANGLANEENTPLLRPDSEPEKPKSPGKVISCVLIYLVLMISLFVLSYW